MDKILFKSGVYNHDNHDNHDEHDVHEEDGNAERSPSPPATMAMAPGKFQRMIEGLTMERLFSIGMFDDVLQASHAVSDVVSSGIDKHDITLVVSDDEAARETLLPHDVTVVHPTSDTQRGYVGGAIGAAAGGLIGSVAMYGLALGSPGGNIPYSIFMIGALGGLLCGMLIGAGTARALPQCRPLLPLPSGSHLPDLGCIGGRNDLSRSMAAGAIGSGLGSIAGVAIAFLMGISTWWFFVTAGLWAGAVCLIVGGLIGGMSGRGMESRAVGVYESLADAGNTILVSVNCSLTKRPEIEQLLLNDGAKMVRVA